MIKSATYIIMLGISFTVIAEPAVYNPATGELSVPVLRISGASNASDPAYSASFIETGGLGSFLFGCPNVTNLVPQPLSGGDGIYDASTSELTLPEVVLEGSTTPRYRVVLNINLSTCTTYLSSARIMGYSCDKQFSALVGFTGTCTEYVGSFWETDLTTIEDQCNQPIQAPTTWSSSSCPQEDLVGYCQMNPSSSLDTLIHYYENYPPELLTFGTVEDTARTTCETQTNAIWVPAN